MSNIRYNPTNKQPRQQQRSKAKPLLCKPCNKPAIELTADNRLRCGNQCPEPITITAITTKSTKTPMIGPYCAECHAYLRREPHHSGCVAAAKVGAVTR